MLGGAAFYCALILTSSTSSSTSTSSTSLLPSPSNYYNIQFLRPSQKRATGDQLQIKHSVGNMAMMKAHDVQGQPI